MIAKTQIRKPEHWQDFETLCKKLWGEVWNCSDTIQPNGRSGQSQCGVDVYGLPKGETGYYGVQCKGKDDYTKSQLTTAEIDEEIEKAKNFKPKLKRLVFATTANRDVKIEEYIRERNIENISNGLFEVYLSSWEDIVDKLDECRSTYNWYINNCQYKDSSDVDVFFEWNKEIEINPQYVRKITSYQYKEPHPFWGNIQQQKIADILSQPSMSIASMMYSPKKVDYRWSYFNVNLKNTGSTVIEDYKLTICFGHEAIEEVSDCVYYFNNPLLNPAERVQANASIDAKREVFAGQKYSNVIEYLPKQPTLVQDDSRIFKIGVKPKDGVTEIVVDWVVLSRDYKKAGKLYIKIVPVYEEQKTIITVYDQSEMRDAAVEIIPKIVEK